jgi:hypothetical protein
MALKDKVSCEDCKSNVRKYADGYILKDFTKFKGDTNILPAVPDSTKFWTYQECKKNSKKLQYLNLTGDCTAFEKVKA